MAPAARRARSDRGRPGDRERALVLLNVLAEKVVLRPPVHRRREIGDCVPEARVARRHVSRAPRPAQVDVARLFCEGLAEHGRKRGRPRPVDAAAVPEQLAVGEHDQQPLGTAMLEPVLRLLRHPLRRGRLRGREEDEVVRAVERVADRSPQVRVRGQARVVAEHTQRPHPVPRLGKPLEPALESGSELPVDGSAVRDEGVVDRRAAAPARSRAHRFITPARRCQARPAASTSRSACLARGARGCLSRVGGHRGRAVRHRCRSA